MSDDTNGLRKAIEERWGNAGSNPKAQRYVGKFWGRTRRGNKITGMVAGNHGNYTVSIETQESLLRSRCSCYIGKHGSCHHCAALGLTFLAEPDSFIVLPQVVVTAVDRPGNLAELQAYLDGVTLDDLVKQMRGKGITQKAFCEAVGMSTQHLSAVKSSELRNRRFHELGAIKLAVLWVLQNLGASSG